MATHSSILAWKIPWTEEPNGLLTVHGVTKSRTRLSDFTFTFHFHALEWVAISFSKGTSLPRDRTLVSYIAGSLLHCRRIPYWLSHQGFVIAGKHNGLPQGDSLSCPLLKDGKEVKLTHPKKNLATKSQQDDYFEALPAIFLVSWLLNKVPSLSQHFVLDSWTILRQAEWAWTQ